MSELTTYEFGDEKFVFEPEIEIGDFGCVIDDDNGNTVSFIGNEPRQLYKILDDYFSDDDSDDSVTTKELFDYQADVLHGCYKEQFGDEDNSDGGPATELLTNLEFDSMNTRPIDDLFEDYGRVMAENDRDHDTVVTMSDVDAEIQSLCERVTELERGEQQ